ncbi:hypothetical protein C8Q77DRAFT_1087618 [Trametes polyzona]|nr:hypothetical protein C8Q77DRAFT_1087618 [Trametes polyzona]
MPTSAAGTCPVGPRWGQVTHRTPKRGRIEGVVEGSVIEATGVTPRCHGKKAVLRASRCERVVAPTTPAAVERGSFGMGPQGYVAACRLARRPEIAMEPGVACLELAFGRVCRERERESLRKSCGCVVFAVWSLGGVRSPVVREALRPSRHRVCRPRMLTKRYMPAHAAACWPSNPRSAPVAAKCAHIGGDAPNGLLRNRVL